MLDIEDLRDEIQSPNFNADEYLESYIQRNMGGFSGSSNGQLFNAGPNGPVSPTFSSSSVTAKSKTSVFDPDRLLQSFNDLMENLAHISNQYSKKYDQALSSLEKKEAQASHNFSERLKKTEQDLDHIQHLESDLSNLARKVYYLCDNINSVSEPQVRLKDTRKLLTHFMELNQEISGLGQSRTYRLNRSSYLSV